MTPTKREHIILKEFPRASHYIRMSRHTCDGHVTESERARERERYIIDVDDEQHVLCVKYGTFERSNDTTFFAPEYSRIELFCVCFCLLFVGGVWYLKSKL